MTLVARELSQAYPDENRDRTVILVPESQALLPADAQGPMTGTVLVLMGGRELRPPHRLRERGESPDGAGQGAGGRDGRPDGARRTAISPAAPASHGKRRPRGARRRRRGGSRFRSQPRGEIDLPSGGGSGPHRRRAQPPSPRLHYPGRRPFRDRLRSRSRSPRLDPRLVEPPGRGSSSGRGSGRGADSALARPPHRRFRLHEKLSSRARGRSRIRRRFGAARLRGPGPPGLRRGSGSRLLSEAGERGFEPPRRRFRGLYRQRAHPARNAAVGRRDRGDTCQRPTSG